MSNEKKLFAVALAAALAISAGASADSIDVKNCTPLGHVGSVSGEVMAAGPGSPERPLECGEVVCVDDVVWSGNGASAGLMLGGVLTQVGPNTRATLGGTPDGTPDVTVESGSVRLIDPRLGGPKAFLGARGARAGIVGSDADVKVGANGAEFCDRDASLTVVRDGQTLTSDAGSCVVVSGEKSLQVARSSAPPVTPGPEVCHDGPDFTPVAHLKPLPPVAGPPRDGPPLPEPPGGPPRGPCDVPGAACRGVQPPPPVVVESDPTMSPFPGGGGFPGGDGFPGNEN